MSLRDLAVPFLAGARRRGARKKAWGEGTIRRNHHLGSQGTGTGLVAAYRRQGWAVVASSGGFEYAERVTGLASFDGVIDRIKQLRDGSKETVLVAIDGAGGAGKSTLASAIADRFDNTHIVCLDDFSQPSRPGWDQERFRLQVLDPLLAGQAASYQRWDWPTNSGAEWHQIPAGCLVLVEGVSSTRTELGDCWDLTLWVETPRALRLARGVQRDGEAMRSRWTDVWMPEEDAYIAAQHPGRRADLIIYGSVTEGPLAP
jgi:uridine kinase